MTAIDLDIDNFIRQEKTKLANERQNLNLLEPTNYYRGNARRRWGPPVDLDSLKSTEKENYKRTWYDLKGKYLEPSSSRKQKDTTMKLSPRGVLDTDALIINVQKEKEREEYEDRWRRYHGEQASSSRGQINLGPINQVDGGTSEPSVLRTGPEFINPRTQRQKDKEEYKRLWQQQHPEQHISDTVKQDGSLFDDSQRNIENKIAEAKQEADDYRKRWEAQHAKGNPSNKRQKADTNGEVLPLGGYDEHRKILNDERKKEYNEMLRQRLETEKSRSQNYGVLIDEDDRLEKMRRLREERKREYNEYLAKQRGYQALPLREQTDEFKVSALGANDSDAVKLQKIKARNDEYNQFLIAKSGEDKNRFADKKSSEDTGIYATIPGLRYSTSAQRRDMAAERNREYNDLLHQKAQNRTRRGGDAPFAGPKQAWSTPTYEEMLDQKRAQENNYRRANDATYETSHNVQENYQDTGLRGPLLELGPKGKRGAGQSDAPFFGTQDIDPRSEKLKRQEEYKRDLQQQMAEAAYARQQQKVDGPLVKTTNIIHQEPVHVIYGGRETSRKDPSVEAYHTKILDSLKKLDEISPQSNAILGRTQPTGDRKSFGGLNLNLNSIRNPIQPAQMEKQGSGTLDLGFGPILEPARLTSLDPPPGLLYQPSTYITANAVPNMNNSVDEAYNFYASRNPLEPYLSGAPAGAGRGGEIGGDIPVPSLDLSRVGRDGAPASKVRFRDSRPQEAPAAGMTFSSDEDRKRNQRQQQSVYREDLERQMLEKNIKKVQDKKAQERYEIKMEEEAKNYDPFGKGGGGAPMRDNQGNVITDLRQIRHDNNNRENKFTPRGYDGDHVGHAGNTTRGAASYRDDLIGPPPAQTTAEGETSFARGGHGIFGMPKTDAEKMQADRYKFELKRQMEEKRAEEYRKKQLERLEEERQQKILDEQRAKMQREFEEEQRRIRDKEEEARRRNEEMIRAVEEKKRETERRKREAEEQRLQEMREEREREVRERQRAESPPVPAARTKTTVDPMPFIQEYAPRTHSADVLNQLAHMRTQLQNERKRVQTMLNDQEDDVDIFDPRVGNRPSSIAVHLKSDFDVFETAMNRNAVAVRRTPGDKANPQAAEDFNALKHKSDSDSRKQFRKMFPEEPVTAEALETQQAALLREQENRLFNVTDRRAYESTPPLNQNRNAHSSSSQLHSKSAFVEVNGIGHYPDDFEDIPRRNDSARSKRRTRVSSSPRVTSPESRSAFGSQTSLNVDKLARKNEDRLKKLRDMQGDDLSLYDPEDVLERFMSKQGHNRPPSGNTLLDETWMKTTNKNPR